MGHRASIGLCVAAFLVARVGNSQACTGLCLQQVSCPNGGTTSVSGVITAPNGVDPLPNILVYVPNAPVAAFAPGVSCAVPGQQPSGSPLVGTVTATDGSFTLTNVPVGTNIPLVVKLGRWRRQVVVPATAACTDTAFSTRLPRNRTEGDIPKIAIVTSATDRMECVLRATGVDDAEFTDPTGLGRINLYAGDSFPGATIDAATPAETDLMSSPATLNQYDDLLLPSQGAYPTLTTPPNASLSNLANFVNAGGRAYLSYTQMVYLQTNDYLPPPNLPLNVEWFAFLIPPEAHPDFPPGTATVNPYLGEAVQFANWMQTTHVTSTPGVIPFASPAPQDVFSILSPTQDWFNNSSLQAPAGILQFVAHTPVGAANQCGRVLFDDYEVVHATYLPPPVATIFPSECNTGFLSPQEHILEYTLLELTPDEEALLEPASGDFGSEKIGFATAPQTFTWTNNTEFPATAYPTASTADFLVIANNCTSVPGAASCQIQVVFKPTRVGPLSATLSVGSTALLSTATAFLQGVGLPDLTLSAGYLDFGGRDVGDPITKTLTVTNPNTVPTTAPSVSTTGDYSATSACGATLSPGATCTISVTFDPTTYGLRTGTLITTTNNPVALIGDGYDFSLVASPDMGKVRAGNSLAINVVTTPLGGFTGTLMLTCTTDAPGAGCSAATIQITGAGKISTVLTLSTTPQYTLPAAAGTATPAALGWASAFFALLVFLPKKRQSRLAKIAAASLLLVCLSFGSSGCTDKFYVLNPSSSPTPPGTYTATLAETDGFFIRTATYTFVVTAQ